MRDGPYPHWNVKTAQHNHSPIVRQSAIICTIDMMEMNPLPRVAELLEGSSGESLPDTAAVPFDAASDVSMDDQK